MKTTNSPVKTKSVKKEAAKTERKESSFKSENTIILTGNLGKDPVILDLGSGRKKAFFTIATRNFAAKKEGQEQQPLWHSLVAWGKLAEKVEASLRIGDRVSVTGRIHNRKYTDKNGVDKIFTEIVMRSMDIVYTKHPVASSN